LRAGRGKKDVEDGGGHPMDELRVHGRREGEENKASLERGDGRTGIRKTKT